MPKRARSFQLRSSLTSRRRSRRTADRGAPANRQLLTTMNLSPLEVLHKPPDHVGVVDALAALVARREGERRGEVGRVGGREFVRVGVSPAND